MTGGVPPSPPDDPDPGLPVLSRTDAATVRELAIDRFAERGLETTVDADALLADGEVFGLSNLAAAAAQTARRDWPALVRGHVDGITTRDDRPASLAEVRDRLLLRLRRVRPRLREPDEHPRGAAREPGAGDDRRATRVTELFGDAVDRLGSLDLVRGVALENLRALAPVDHQRVDELMLRCGVPPSPHGVLVIVPNRHVLAVHPLTGAGVLSVLPVLLAMAQGEFDGQPGALSPHLYFRPAVGAAFEQATVLGDDGLLGVRLDGSLEQAFRRLGLVERD